MTTTMADTNTTNESAEDALKHQVFDVFRKSGNKPLSADEIQCVLEARQLFFLHESESDMAWELLFRDLAHEKVRMLLPVLKENNYSILEIMGLFNIKYSKASNIRQVVIGNSKPWAEWVYRLDAKGKIRRSRAELKKPLMLTYSPSIAFEACATVKASQRRTDEAGRLASDTGKALLRD